MATLRFIEFHFDHDIYTVMVDGIHVKVTVTASASVVGKWLSTTRYFQRRYVYLKHLVVGLGVQWTPGVSDPPLDTLQLGVGRRCLIFQLAHADRVPRRLRTLLRNPSHTFVGFWNHSDRRKLGCCKFGLEMARDPMARDRLDLRLYAKTEHDENLTKASVEQIVEKCLGYKVERKREIGMTGWKRYKYRSNDQVVYAAVDAYCAFLIGRNSKAWELNR